MPFYAWKALDSKGEKRQGFFEAHDESELEEYLLSQGLLLTSATLRKGQGAVALDIRKVGRIRRRELVEFCIALNLQLSSGISLLHALKDMATDATNPSMRIVCEEIAKALENGSAFASALRQFPNVFTDEFFQMVRAGEKSGTLAFSLKELQEYLEWQERLAGEVKQATTYPAVLVTVLGGFVLYLFTFVIPKIAAVITQMKMELPLVTRLVLGVSHFFIHWWWIIIPSLVAAPFLHLWLLRHREPYQLWWDGLKLRLPLFGPLNSMIMQARFTKNFAVLHRAGIPLIETLELCAGLVGNAKATKAITSTIGGVREGQGLAESLRETQLFSGIALRMITVGEKSGNLGEALDHAARYFDQEVPRRIKRFFSIFEPAMILSLIALVGTVALAIFLPIISMSSGLRQ